MVTLVGSRFTHAAESRYASVADEACDFVLCYRDLIVAVGHKPLLRLLGDRALDVRRRPCAIASEYELRV